MNIDAAIKSNDQFVGLGIVIRNHKVEFIVVAVKKSRFVVESDCQEVVNLITGKKSRKLEIGWIISEAQQRIKKLKNVIV